MNINMGKFLEQFKEEYNFLYERNDNVEGFAEAVEAFDNFIENPANQEMLMNFNELRGDIISSDREAAAFMRALAAFTKVPPSQMEIAAMRIDGLLNHQSKAHCEYLVMDETYMGTLVIPEFARDSRGNPLLIGDQYMVVTCANGYKYYINVTADSVLAACAEVFNFIQHKL